MKVVLSSLPGIYPSFPAIGLEIVAHSLRKCGREVEVVNAHLDLCRYMDLRLLRKVCIADIWESFYGNLVYPGKNVGLSNEALVDLLCDPHGGYGFTKHEIDLVRKAISRFNVHIVETLSSLSLDGILGFGIQNTHLLIAKHIAGLVRERLGGAVQIIVGGASVKFGLGRCVLSDNEEFDYSVESDGCNEMDSLIRGISPENIEGIYFRSKSGSVKKGHGKKKAQLCVPETDIDYREFYEQRREIASDDDFTVYHPFDGIPAWSAMGCRWGKCRFCGVKERVVAHASQDDIVEAIDRRAKINGINKIFLMDLSQPEDEGLEFLLLQLEKRGAVSVIGSEIRCDISRAGIAKLSKNGFNDCQLGIEALSERLLRKMGKGVGVIDIIRTMIACVEYGVRYEGNIILDSPWEELEDVHETESMLRVISHLPRPKPIRFYLSRGSSAFRKFFKSGGFRWVVDRKISYAYPVGMRKHLHAMNYIRYPWNFKNDRAWHRVLEVDDFNIRNPSTLDYHHTKSGIVIRDTRAIAVCNSMRFEGDIYGSIYEYCKEIRTWKEIRQEFPDRGVGEIRKALREFVDARVMLRHRGKYLSIALSRDMLR